MTPATDTDSTDVDVEELVDEFIDDLPMTDQSRMDSKRLAYATIKDSDTNHQPRSIAAAAIYVAGLLTDQDISQRAISDVSNVSRSTIGQVYQKIFVNSSRYRENDFAGWEPSAADIQQYEFLSHLRTDN